MGDAIEKNATTSVVGQGIARIDTREKAHGAAEYVDDIQLSGMLYGAILKSPYAHARILSIDTQKALALPGVKAVITGKDLPKTKFCIVAGLFSEAEKDKLPIERDKVRYVGDEVAAVAAEDIETAEGALELIDVTYEVLPSVLDPEEALKSGAPSVHDDKEQNVSFKLDYRFGDVKIAFAEADFVFEDQFKTSQQAHCCMEPHGCIAKWDENGKLTVWSSTQIASGYQRELSQVLGLPFGKVRVIKTAVGGSFGGKMMMHALEPIAAYLSQKAKRPVKLIYSRDEEFICSRTRHPVIVDIKTGVKKDGTITARECRIIQDNGAYNAQGPMVMVEVAQLLCSYYNPKNISVSGVLVYTNKPWGGSFRGYGNPQANFVIESQMDIIAGKLNMDPVEFRLKNSIKPGDVTATKWKISSCGYDECLKEAASAIEWKNKRGKSGNRGVGIASCIHWGGGVSSGSSTICTAIVEVKSGGQVTVSTGACEIGQGSDTVLAQIAVEELGVPFENAIVVNVDTDITPTFFYVGNPTTFVAGNAVKLAAMDARRQLLESVSKEKGMNADDLEIKQGYIYHKNSEKKIISVGDAAFNSWEANGIPIVGKGRFDQGASHVDVHSGEGHMSPTYSFAAQAVEVEVDPVTGEVKVLNCVSVHDSGRIINPVLAEGQVEGGVATGIGYALSEGLEYNELGKALNASFTDYKVLRAQDMPKIKTIFTNTFDDVAPLGAKSIGEVANVNTAAAIANAIEDAIGLRIKELPITPEKIVGK